MFPLAPALALLLTAPASGLSETVDVAGEVKVGAAMPSFAGWGMSGTMVSLSRVLKGERGETPRPVVVSFFATWCQPCKKGLPALAAVTKERNAKLILVAYAEDADKVRPFLAELGIDAIVVLDPYLKIAKRVGVDNTLPRTYILDENGIVRTIFVKEGDDFAEKLAVSFDQLDTTSSTTTKGVLASPLPKDALRKNQNKKK